MADPGYQFGPFFVDRARYRVVRDDAIVELSPQLLDLLLHLLDNAGALVTKEQLLDALWPNANVTDNALAQAVSELRQALGDDAGDPSVHQDGRASRVPLHRTGRPDRFGARATGLHDTGLPGERQ